MTRIGEHPRRWVVRPRLGRGEETDRRYDRLPHRT